MVRMLTGLVGATIVSAAVVLAAQQTPAEQRPAQQTPAQPPSGQQPSTPSATAKTEAMTFVGCLKAGTTPGTYTLAEATQAGQAGATTTAESRPGAAGGETRGENRAQATTGRNRSFTLSGQKLEDLSKHVNHKIEVMGTVSRAGGTATTGSTPSGQTPPSGAAQSGAAQSPQETLTIQSFKMVSATCP